jgi:hypothetical protein
VNSSKLRRTAYREGAPQLVNDGPAIQSHRSQKNGPARRPASAQHGAQRLTLQSSARGAARHEPKAMAMPKSSSTAIIIARGCASRTKFTATLPRVAVQNSSRHSAGTGGALRRAIQAWTCCSGRAGCCCSAAAVPCRTWRPQRFRAAHGRRSGGSPNPGVDLELCVKSHGTWEVVDKDEVVLMPDKVIRCRFDLDHEVFPGGFYDVRWFRADDRGKLIEITRERFQRRNHPVGRKDPYRCHEDRDPQGDGAAAT